jgi:nicotinate-nucleotide pyrophosphorylase (carboxylating)
VTSESVIPATARFAGVMDSRDAITVCGLPIAAAFFRALDPAMAVEILVGRRARRARQRADAAGRQRPRDADGGAQRAQHRAALVRHRHADADVCRCDGRYPRACSIRARPSPACAIWKNTPCAAAGSNHRMGLWDAAMIKDNHVLVAGGVGEAVRRALAAG